MQISKRLRTVADMVSTGNRLADVGTDHGYVPVFLVLENRIPSAVAMDINRGPLERARLHIRKYGLEARIETRLSDGLEKLLPGEADTVLIAGMGGMLTIRILENGQKVLQTAKELILQPQSDIREVRLFLKKNGYRIAAEDMVEEDGKFYPMMRAVRSEQISGAEQQERERFRMSQNVREEVSCAVRETQENRKTEEEELCWRYGPALLGQRHPALLRYLEREQAQLEKVREKLSRESGPAAVRRLAEIEEDLRLNGEARAHCLQK